MELGGVGGSAGIEGGTRARACGFAECRRFLVGRAGFRLAHGGGASRAERAALRDALRT